MLEPTYTKEIDAITENGLIRIIREAKSSRKKECSTYFNKLDIGEMTKNSPESDEKMFEIEERRNSKERHKKSGINLLAREEMISIKLR